MALSDKEIEIVERLKDNDVETRKFLHAVALYYKKARNSFLDFMDDPLVEAILEGREQLRQEMDAHLFPIVYKEIRRYK